MYWRANFSISLQQQQQQQRAAAAECRKYWAAVRKHKQGGERVRDGVASLRWGGLDVAPPI